MRDAPIHDDLIRGAKVTDAWARWFRDLRGGSGGGGGSPLYANLAPPADPATLLGRRSGSGGPWEAITLVGLSMVGTELRGYVPTRSVVPYTTGVLVEDAIETGEIPLGFRSALLLRLASDRPGMLVLYASEAALLGDGRGMPPATDPDPNVGVLAEFIFGPSGGDFAVTPPVTLHSGLTPAPSPSIWYRYRSEGDTPDETQFAFTIVGLD